MTEAVSSRIRRLLTSESKRIDNRLVGLAAVIYCLFAIWLTARNSPWIAGDSIRYLDLSQGILRGQFGLMHNGVFDPEAWRQPGYPAFLALGSLIFGKSRLALIILQHGLTLTSIILSYLVVRKELSQAAARVFLILCSIYPFIAEATAKFLTESLCLFLISLAVYAMSARKAWSPYVAGLCGALAASVRPNLMLLPIVYALGYLLSGRSTRKALAVCAVAAIALVPWSIRNDEVFGRFSPMPPGGGPGGALMMAAWETRMSDDALFQYGFSGRVTPELQRSGMLELQAQIDKRLNIPPDRVCWMMDSYETSEKMIAADGILKREAIGVIKTAPGTYLLRTLWNVPRMWFSAAVESRMSPVKRYPMIALGVSVWALGVIGFVLPILRLRAMGSEALIVLCILPVYFTLTLCWFQHDARYTVPARLALLGLAAYAIAGAAGANRPAALAPKEKAVSLN